MLDMGQDFEAWWQRRWPDLFAGLSDEHKRIVNNAIANNVLEGWEPTRGQVEGLVNVVRGELGAEEHIANVCARTRSVAAL